MVNDFSPNRFLKPGSTVSCLKFLLFSKKAPHTPSFSAGFSVQVE